MTWALQSYPSRVDETTTYNEATISWHVGVRGSVEEHDFNILEMRSIDFDNKECQVLRGPSKIKACQRREINIPVRWGYVPLGALDRKEMEQK